MLARYCTRRLSSHAAPALPASPFRKPPTVAVGVSGGVDSSVTALLLQAAGFEVRGVFMRNWDSSDEQGAPVCTVTDDLKSAQAVSQHLGLRTPLHEVSFVAEYWSSVFQPFLDAYKNGRTPNPDVTCNQYVKFDAFRKHCLGKEGAAIGADLMATGHYGIVWPPPVAATAAGISEKRDPAKYPLIFSDPQRFAEKVLEGLRKAQVSGGSVSIDEALRTSPALLEALDGARLAPDAQYAIDDFHSDGHPTGPCLLAAVDQTKDQTDFLCRVSGQAFKRVVLPLGALHKSLVREIASAAGLPTASRKDSYGICFIGKRSLGDFIGQYVTLSKGAFRDVETGELMGTTDAIESFTIGQRAKLGGTTEPYFVVGMDRGVDVGQPHGAAAARELKRGQTPVKTSSADRGKAKPGNNGGSVSGAGRNNSKTNVATDAADTGNVIWVAKGRAHPSLLFTSCATRMRDMHWTQPLGTSGSGSGSDIKVPAEFSGALAHALSRRLKRGASSEGAPAVPIRYRIRHRQTDFCRAEARLLWRSEWLQGSILNDDRTQQAFAAFRRRLLEAAEQAEAQAASLAAEEHRLRQFAVSGGLRFKLQAVAAKAAKAAAKAREARHWAGEHTCAMAFTRGMGGDIRAAVADGLREAAAGGGANKSIIPAAPAAALEVLIDPSASASLSLPVLAAGARKKREEEQEDELLLVVTFNHKLQRGVAAGQELTFYSDSETSIAPFLPSTQAQAPPSVPTPVSPDAGRLLLGGGPIWAAGPSLRHVTPEDKGTLANRAAHTPEWVE